MVQDTTCQILLKQCQEIQEVSDLQKFSVFCFINNHLTPFNRDGKSWTLLPPHSSDATMDIVQSKHSLPQNLLAPILLTNQRWHKRGNLFVILLTHKTLCYFLVDPGFHCAVFQLNSRLQFLPSPSHISPLLMNLLWLPLSFR